MPRVPTRTLLIASAALLLLFAGMVWLVIRLKSGPPEAGVAGRNGAIAETAAPSPLAAARNVWKAEAYATLEKFLNATTVDERMGVVIPRPGLREDMTAFHAVYPINDQDTPAELFSSFGSPAKDLDRGIYLLKYDLPLQIPFVNMFRPVAPRRVLLGLEPADSRLRIMAGIENFTAPERHVMAFLVKTPEGLKLDWDTFVQTKYQTFQQFLAVAEPGRKGVFRVAIWEDVPEGGGRPVGYRSYKISPPTGPEDAIRADVATDSEIGRILAVLNWRGTGDFTTRQVRSATVELEWVGSADEPKVAISRFLCWEFLGVGGEEGNHLATGK